MASPNELSFLPDDYLERKAQRRTNVICALLFLIVMIAIGSAFTYTERMGKQVEQDHIAVEQRYTEAAKRIELKAQLEEQQGKMEKQAELSASLLEKVPRSYLLAKVTNSLPVGVSLLDMSLESKLRSAKTETAKNAFEAKRATTAAKKKAAANSTATPAPPAQQAKLYDVTMKITGMAFTDVQVAQFISKLNQARAFRDVNLLISDQFTANEVQMRKFQLEIQLDPDFETAGEPEKSKTAAVELKETTP